MFIKEGRSERPSGLFFSIDGSKSVTPRLAFWQTRFGYSSDGAYVLCCCWSRRGLLAADNGVVGTLVEDGVAPFGAHDEVMGGRWVEINLRVTLGTVDRETADVVVYQSIEGRTWRVVS